MRRISTAAQLAALLVFTLAGSAWHAAQAQGNTQNRGGSGGSGQTAGARGGAATTAQAMDHKFVMDAAHGNLAEIRMGEAALQRATSPDVRSFAQMMIADHTKANAELAQLAQRMGMTLPTELDPHHRASMEGMSRLSGMEFDMAYVKGQMADHALTLDMLMMYDKEGRNNDLENYAKRMRPAVERHYQMVRQMDMRMHAAMMTTAGT